MRITTWNCQGAFRKKEDGFRALAPDIAIIQECESLDKFKDGSYQGLTLQWFGETGKKGIGICAHPGFHFELYRDYDASIRYCIPLIVVSGPVRFHLLAMWAMNDTDQKIRYIRQVRRAIERYRDFILERDCIVAGDFNSNRIFDHNRPTGDHISAVNSLKAAGLTSAYHHFFHEEQGEESRNTFYLYRKQPRGFHIDYCFVPDRWTAYIVSVAVGDYNLWHALSDHCPLTVDLALKVPPDEQKNSA